MRQWKNNIRRVEPYTPGEQPQGTGIIKLNTNENPYPPAPGVMTCQLDPEKYRLYPDPTVGDLVRELSTYHGLEEDQVFVGVGSDDVLATCFMTFFNSDLPICFPDITYSFYDVWAELFRIPYERKPLNEAFELQAEDYYAENGGVIFPNPNAPTGLAAGQERIRDILEHNRDVIVIIDEAYIDFGGESALPLLNEYDNLIIVRTFSKSRSLAGLRIGYAMGNSELIKALLDVKYSYNSYTMNRPSIVLGVESVRDEAYFRETVSKIVTTREWVKKELSAMGFVFPDSQANFIFASHPGVSAAKLYQAAKEKQIYVRYFDKLRIDRYLRITIGTDDEMKAFLKFVKEYLQEVGI